MARAAKVRLAAKKPVKRVVYLLWHCYEYPSGRDEEKFIGAYSSESAAKRTVKRLRGKPGFRKYPRGFVISETTLDPDGWTEGFVTIRSGREKTR